MTLPTRILLATDFSGSAETAEAAAIDLAKRLSAELHVLHVYEAPSAELPPHAIPLVTSYVEDLRRVAEERLAEVQARALTAGITAESQAEPGPCVEAIAERAEEIRADLIVVGTEGRSGVRRFLLGSIAEGVARHAPCSVLAVRPGPELFDGAPIVLADDFSRPAERAREAAVDLARACGTSLHVVHAINLGVPGVGAAEVAEPGRLFEFAFSLAQTKIEEFSNGIDVAVSTDIAAEAPLTAICNAAESRKAPLVVVGTHGRTGVGRALLGSVAERTMRHAPCSVLVVRSH
jgi:nucleotide-binding universal stress UspA family protein